MIILFSIIFGVVGFIIGLFGFAMLYASREREKYANKKKRRLKSEYYILMFLYSSINKGEINYE